jgi:hypothetical protein
MILTRSTRFNQPRGPVEVDRQNLLADGIEFAYIPGFGRDLNGKHGSIQSVGPGTSFLNGTMVTPGAGRNNGLILASGALLGPLQNSTVLAVVNTRAGLVSGIGIEADGLIGSGGNAIYSERAPTGNDIYKLSLTALTGPTLNAEFTYRNDGATLLQQRAVISGYNDGRQLAVAAVKNGTAHSVYCESISSTGTFGSASSAFTNANIQRRLGSDAADVTSAWNGQILLVVGWSRALSVFEIAEVKANPWQLFRPVQRRIYFDMGAGGGAGTSPVSSDLGAIYGIRSSVQADSASAYDVRAAVQADSGAAFDILGPVSADSTGAYTILTSALSDLGASFDVRAAVQADSGAAFLVRGSTQADASAAYLLRGSVSSDIGGTYDILNANSVSSSLSSTYVVRGAAQADVSASFDLRSSIGAISEGAFMVRGLVSSDLGASFDVQAALMPVYADLPGSYAIEGPTFGGDLSPADIAAIRSAVRTELSAELTAIIQIQTKVDAAL